MAAGRFIPSIGVTPKRHGVVCPPVVVQRSAPPGICNEEIMDRYSCVRRFVYAPMLVLLGLVGGCLDPSNGDTALPEAIDGADASIGHTSQAVTAYTFRVMGLNARIPITKAIGQKPADSPDNAWVKRRLRIRDMIKQNGIPGIIGLTELDRASAAEDGTTSDMLRDILADLNETGANWTNRTLTPGVPSGQAETIAILWDKTKFDYIATNSLVVTPSTRRWICNAGQPTTGCKEDYPNASTLFNCEDNGYNRGVLTVHLADKATGKSFYVYVTHFPAPLEWPQNDGTQTLNACERAGMAQELFKFAANRSHPTDPIILLGDFNAGYTVGANNRPVYRDDYHSMQDLFAMGDRPLYDPFLALRPTDRLVQSFNSFDLSAGRRGSKIDHILLTKGGFSDVRGAWIDRLMFASTGSPGVPIACTDPKTDGLCDDGQTNVTTLRYYSDHWAVFADIAP